MQVNAGIRSFPNTPTHHSPRRMLSLLTRLTKRKSSLTSEQLQSPIGPFKGYSIPLRIGLSPILRAGIGMTDGELLTPRSGVA